MNDEDFEDDDEDIFARLPYRLVESKPLSRYDFLQAGFTIVTGTVRAVLEALVQLSDAFVGAEGYTRQRREFQDEARVAIESIVDGTAEDGD